MSPAEYQDAADRFGWKANEKGIRC